MFIFVFKQKSAYEMRISDWSSDVCSSDLDGEVGVEEALRLLHDRLDDARVGVTDVDDADPAREVDEHVAVDVRDRRILRARGEDRQVDEQRLGEIGRASCRERV